MRNCDRGLENAAGQQAEDRIFKTEISFLLKDQP